MEGTGALIKATVALLIIMDPLGNLPIFMGLTEGLGSKGRHRAFRIAAVVSLVLLLAFAFGGSAVLALFGITLYDFEIAGGLLLLAIALKILVVGHGRETAEGEEVGAVPIACPLLVGPGAMTTVIVIAKSYGHGVALGAVFISFSVVALILTFSEHLYKLLGRTGALVLSKVMAVLIAGIGVMFVREGLQGIGAI
ncbi:MAG TPA: MarC family protein [Armatimonadetes bacterium]|nr:MarC family protein [Armatimonadota bacterium]